MEQQIVFFDGVCALCNRFVRALLWLDRSEQLKFAPLQGETARELLPTALTETISTVVLYDRGAISTESTAALRTLAQTTVALRWILIGLLIPRAMRDGAYRLVARNRYNLFGTYESCPLPNADNQSRFLP